MTEGSKWYDPYPNTKDNRELLFDYLPKRSRGAEIGVWSGRFSKALLNALDPYELHLVDPWTFRASPEFNGALYSGTLARSQDDMDELYLLVVENFRFDKRVHIHRNMSTDAASKFDKNSLDWVYIDGDHRYPSVSNDLRSWSEIIVPGGLLSGDDYGTAGWWSDGVTLAVDEFITQRDCEVLTLSDHQFVLRLNS